MESSSNNALRPAAGLTRVFIWCVPRTLGTALTKCLSYVDGIQIFNEPFGSAMFFGPEGRTPDPDFVKFIERASANQQVIFEHAIDDSKCTYGWVKQQLEADYPGKKVLLVRDQAPYLDEKYDTIPSGFRHAFLIRHPYKVLPSYKRIVTKMRKRDMPNGYEMQFKLLKYVQEHLDPNPIIIDADDLQSNPSSILSQFCQAVGIPYSDSLLEWPADRDIMKTWIGSRIDLQGSLLEDEGGYYDKAINSSRFLPITAIPERSELSQDIQEAADYSMPFYEKMYQLLLKP
ncbi:uncharacterized protein [Amphiura filiformis]|uniref:uncharacterized protein n=1 Tax=Amphiura filiformis TaxID=82378 RepID=UPI003B20BC39